MTQAPRGEDLPIIGRHYQWAHRRSLNLNPDLNTLLNVPIATLCFRHIFNVTYTADRSRFTPSGLCHVCRLDYTDLFVRYKVHHLVINSYEGITPQKVTVTTTFIIGIVYPPAEDLGPAHYDSMIIDGRNDMTGVLI